MAQDLDPWRLFSSSPQEESAFRLLSAHLTAQGQHVALRGKPDDERARYQALFEVDAGVLTVDAHLAVDGMDWFVDHTMVPLPGSTWIPSAMRVASETLNRLLVRAVLLSPTGGLLVTVTPQQGKVKERNRYFARVVALAERAARSGRPVFDTEDPRFDPFSAYPVAEPWTPADPSQPVMLSFALPEPLQVRHRLTPHGWVHDLGPVGDALARPIHAKLTDHKEKTGGHGQLRRAAELGLRTGLVLDVRVGWQPPALHTDNSPPRRPSPAIAPLHPDVARHLMREATSLYPGVLKRAWLVNADDTVHEVYAGS
ncbi:MULTISPECIES: hypothetical protein [unclassified Streptomyces]|uniref:hypothetical protein n=1 Tax=unclassified Streptomyces TaxID=2593676 RepID=UPI00131C1306|nr:MULTISPECIES: hypothetical protein [unclassified Streptomyces]MYX24879.1 hypothetical protein [Streptomyces sp. SID8380]